MEVWNEPAVLFEKSTMFTKSRFCKIYKVTSENPSGYLPHSHDYMQIWYITRGCCEHWVEGQKHLMARGDIFIVPPKVEHQVVRLEDAEIISYIEHGHLRKNIGIVLQEPFLYSRTIMENIRMIDPRMSEEQVHEAALNLSFAWLFLKDADDIHSQFSLRPETGERVNTLMNAMLVEYENGDIYYEEFLRGQIMELLLVLAREYSQSPQSHTAAAVYDKYKPMVEDAIRYVEAHYNEPLKLEDVCRISMVSKTYFCYLFKLLTQQTLVEYIMNLRIQKAIELLKDPANSITWVGYEVGFNDSTHFSRTFKKVVGISPRTYRAIKNSES